MKKIIILMGVPGSGKGTQANMLCDRTGYAHISTGDLLRALELDPAADAQDKEKLAAMKAGQLVSDELIFKLAFTEIQKHVASGRGVVLDGAIRNIEQAQAYEQFFVAHGWQNEVLVIEITISDEETWRRVEMRIASGRGRADDDRDVVQKRINAQGNKAIRPILEYYKNLGVLETINGLESIESVAAQIQQIVGK
jgi:adenylate kinase